MFGFQGGESPDTVARKKGYMQDAQQRWGFMTQFDLSTIKNEVQLSTMVKDRSGISGHRPRATFRPGCEASRSDTWGAAASCGTFLRCRVTEFSTTCAGAGHHLGAGAE
jgi:hypothetical protein